MKFRKLAFVCCEEIFFYLEACYKNMYNKKCVRCLMKFMHIYLHKTLHIKENVCLKKFFGIAEKFHQEG